ncbi:sOS mutagenesis and repair protein UmuD [Salmonella enterica]|nr:sOS mutagenesis and repair protein UmuD [Salmonella enterica]EBP8178039.1 sOS mutagenesis and repair protein UmuD [Salmonella enterica]EIP9721307.1 sOS mutagenesis and repair protein UmuD [Salmonella enterica]
MGFVSPATDYIENKISLDHICRTQSPGVFMFSSGVTSYREGIKPGALLIVDFGATPVDGSIVVCVIDGEFRLMRLRKHPAPYLQHLDQIEKVHQLQSDGDNIEIRGVVTHIVSDARTGEFEERLLL